MVIVSIIKEVLCDRVGSFLLVMFDWFCFYLILLFKKEMVYWMFNVLRWDIK